MTQVGVVRFFAERCVVVLLASAALVGAAREARATSADPFNTQWYFVRETPAAGAVDNQLRRGARGNLHYNLEDGQYGNNLYTQWDWSTITTGGFTMDASYMGAACASWGNSRIDLVFVAAGGGNIAHGFADSGALSWNQWGSDISSLGWHFVPQRPAIASAKLGRVDVYATAFTGNDYWGYPVYRLLHSSWDNGVFVDWQVMSLNENPIGRGVAAAGLSGYVGQAGRLDLFYQGIGSGIVHTWSTDGGASYPSYENIGAPDGGSPGLMGEPSAAKWGTSRNDLIIKGWDGHLWHAWSDGGAFIWNQWFDAQWSGLNSPWVGNPSITAYGNAELIITGIVDGGNKYVEDSFWDHGYVPFTLQTNNWNFPYYPYQTTDVATCRTQQ